MAWRTANLQDLASHISQAEIDAYRQSEDFDTGEDPVPKLIEEISYLVRGYCRKNAFVNLGPGSSLPLSLISPAMDIVAFKMLKRMPMEVTRPRELAYEKAIAMLEQVARDEVRPESYIAEGGLDPDDFRNLPFYNFPMRPETLNPTMLRGAESWPG